MPSRGPWDTIVSDLALTTPHFVVYRDRVVRPDGAIGHYDWFAAPDQVRVAAIVDGSLILVDQYHNLIGQTLQLPGGSVCDDEASEMAARRELAQETGLTGGTWTNDGTTSPLPGLTPARSHLWVARDLTPGPASPEPSEGDLRVVRLSMAAAREAVLDGAVQCAASAALVLRVATRCLHR